jgi:NADP-dependent 3-hydroxy acid dehydrogenase YdfG
VTRLVEAGWRVGALARTATDLASLAAGHPDGTVLPLVADVTDRVAMAEAAAALTALWAIPDLVIANAGILAAAGRTWELDPISWWSEFEVNLLGVLNTIHVTVPGMVARQSGRFIAVSSGMGGAASPWSSAYGASKSAVTHLVGSLGRELEGTGVVAFAISPGMVRTEMTDWPVQLTAFRPELAQLPDSAFVPIHRVGDLVIDLASGRFDRLSGKYLHVADDRERLLLQF